MHTRANTRTLSTVKRNWKKSKIPPSFAQTNKIPQKLLTFLGFLSLDCLCAAFVEWVQSRMSRIVKNSVKRVVSTDNGSFIGKYFAFPGTECMTHVNVDNALKTAHSISRNIIFIRYVYYSVFEWQFFAIVQMDKTLLNTIIKNFPFFETYLPKTPNFARIFTQNSSLHKLLCFPVIKWQKYLNFYHNIFILTLPVGRQLFFVLLLLWPLV